MSEHTQGPYDYGEDRDGWFLESIPRREKFGRGHQIAYCLKEADARRISAVLNACIDLPDEALAGGWTAKGMIAYAKSLEQKNAELLEALQTLDSLWGENEANAVDFANAIRRARAAIAKAKGGAT